jgi:hypothetical protein
VAFSDLEMQAIMEAAANLDQEKRSVFLMRVAAIRNLKHTSGIDAVILFDEETALKRDGLLRRADPDDCVR